MSLTRRALLFTAPLAIARPSRAADEKDLICPIAAAPPVLIPGLSPSLGADILGGQIYRGLLRYGKDGALAPDLATAWEVSLNRLTYTFHLLRGATWHDGGGFDASDVVFSLTCFHRALHPELPIDLWTVTAPDDFTVTIALPVRDDRFPAWLDVLTLPIVPQHVHNRSGWGTDPRKVTPVGMGPFRFAEWLRLVRYDWYAGPLPAIGTIECPILPKAEARLALAEHEPNVLLAEEGLDRQTMERLRAVPDLAVEGALRPGGGRVAGLKLATAGAPLNSADVREGLSLAIDRGTLLRSVWDGMGRIEGVASADPRAAAERFNQAQLRPDDEGIRARLQLATPWPALLPALRQSFGQAGIEVLAASTDTAALTTLLAYPWAAPESVIWLVEPATPFIRSRSISLPGGLYGNWAEAGLA